MPKKKKNDTNPDVKPVKKIRPALSPEAREAQLISLATDLAAQQLIDGTASAQVITHFLKLATEKDRIEREIMERQKELLTAKTEALQSAKRVEELYTDALEAMRRYSGNYGTDEYYGENDSDL